MQRLWLAVGSLMLLAGACGSTAGGAGDALGPLDTSEAADAPAAADGPAPDGSADSQPPRCPPRECPNGSDACCPFGTTTDSQGCSTCTCAPAPGGCSPAECTATPPPVIPLCGGNPVGMFVCERDASGACGYRAVCPGDSCPPEQCGRQACAACVPPAKGTFWCARGLDHTCGWRLSCLGFEGTCGTINDRAACEGDNRCRWLDPGCTEPKLAAAGCYDRADLECAPGSACSRGRICVKRVINPCPAGDAGACAACGAELALCL